MKYRATYTTTANITVDIDVPDEVIEEHTHPEDGLDEGAIDEWVAYHSHTVADEAIETWGVFGDVRPDISLDGIGADAVERVND